MKCQYCGSTIKNNKPALKVIAAFGGVTRMSIMTGINHQAIYRWRYPKGKNKGTGGVIPLKYHYSILMAAVEHDIDIKAEDLVA